MKFLNITEPSNNRPRKWSLIPICLLLIPFLCLLLASCNGGGGGAIAGGGIDGTGIMSAGVVTAIGSIEVNGTEFDTTNALVIVNGVAIGVGDEAVEDNLQVGMVVSVEGRILADGGVVADRVIYTSNVTGPVTNVGSVDPDTNERIVTVMGQTVVVNFITKFVNTGFNDIFRNDVVVVSGYRDFDGSIRATFFEETGNVTTIVDYEVAGFVENLDTDFKTFMINGLDVDYAAISNILPQGIPAEGLLVEVEGRLDGAGILIAANIQLGDELDGEDGNEFEIMGFVTEIISAGEIIKFKVGNQEVRANSDPDIVEYVDGEPGDIALGKRLEAEGVFEGGILFADEIEFWEPDQIEVEGVVDEVIFIGGLLEFTFEERDNQVFQTIPETIFENIEKENIEAGIELEVKGRPKNLEQDVIEADKVSLEIE